MTMIQKPATGLLQTQKSVQDAMLLLRKMEVATIWCARTKTARRIFVGFAWGLGNLMVALGIIAIGKYSKYCFLGFAGFLKESWYSGIGHQKKSRF